MVPNSQNVLESAAIVCVALAFGCMVFVAFGPWIIGLNRKKPGLPFWPSMSLLMILFSTEWYTERAMRLRRWWIICFFGFLGFAVLAGLLHDAAKSRKRYGHD